jgi:phosphoribosyl 1,2-cyclic phosphodiesterase
LLESKPQVSIDHLSLLEAKQLIIGIKPKAVILTHFGMSLWRAKPWEVARQLSEETGISVIAASDGMKFDLTELGKCEK